jgi:hypothetical protein
LGEGIKRTSGSGTADFLVRRIWESEPWILFKIVPEVKQSGIPDTCHYTHLPKGFDFKDISKP